jgi:arylsulfatase A-like enzyme
VRTPWLDRVARGGTLFAQAVADVPVTLPSHTTLLTGVPALGHGVRYNADFRVGADAVTLAETLRQAGFATGAIVSSLVLDARFGLDQGFDHYDDDLTPGYVKHDESLYPDRTQWLPKADRRADETAARAADWLRGAPSPFLCWVHFYDAHFPYDPPPPWGLPGARPAPGAPPAERLYGAEIQFTDRQLGRILSLLEEHGPRGLVVAVTADHGEGLDQHREDGHGIFVYDETVRVPLAVRGPDVPAGGVVGGQVRTIDVAPTLLELAGRPARLGIGRSLVAAMRDPRGAGERPAYCESIKSRLFYGGTGLKAVRTGGAKYVWAPRPEVYDLRADPGETRNLAEEDPARADALRDELVSSMRSILDGARPVSETASLDEDTAAQLRALGYASGGEGGAPGSLADELELAGHDPKDLVDVSMAAREIENGFPENARLKLERFFRTARTPREDPRMARLWAAAHLNAAKLRFDARDWAGAAEEYGNALLADPGYGQARWRRIYTLNLAGSWQQAAAEGLEVLDGSPDAWRVRLHAALALALLRRREEARAELAAVAGGADAPEDVAKAARWYLERIGAPDEAAALARYRGAEE